MRDFYNTRAGQQFYENNVPRIAKSLEILAEEQEKANQLKERELQIKDYELKLKEKQLDLLHKTVQQELSL